MARTGRRLPGLSPPPAAPVSANTGQQVGVAGVEEESPYQENTRQQRETVEIFHCLFGMRLPKTFTIARHCPRPMLRSVVVDATPQFPTDRSDCEAHLVANAAYLLAKRSYLSGKSFDSGWR